MGKILDGVAKILLLPTTVETLSGVLMRRREQANLGHRSGQNRPP